MANPVKHYSLASCCTLKCFDVGFVYNVLVRAPTRRLPTSIILAGSLPRGAVSLAAADIIKVTARLHSYCKLCDR